MQKTVPYRFFIQNYSGRQRKRVQGDTKSSHRPIKQVLYGANLQNNLHPFTTAYAPLNHAIADKLDAEFSTE